MADLQQVVHHNSDSRAFRVEDWSNFTNVVTEQQEEKQKASRKGFAFERFSVLKTTITDYHTNIMNAVH